jgi:maltooligosyltrehalose trehalohydrolase
VENLLHWVHEYHVDGFRLDATHAIHDESPVHILAELSDAARASGQAGQAPYLIAETHENDLRYLRPTAEGGFGFDAVWADDFHHALRTLLTGEREGYYGDYRGSVAELARQLERRPPERLVYCSQNHDQVGNRPGGDRPKPEELRVRAACTLLAPQTPLLFMGEEYGERRPFQFFTDHIDPFFAEATREGRKREFARFSGFSREDVPDPQDPATFERSKLDPSRGDPDLLAFYGRLLELRRRLPREVETEADEQASVLRLRRAHAELVADFARRTVALEA